MKKVEIYDQYRAVYSDPNDSTTLIHPPEGSSITVGENLLEEDALQIVSHFYETSKLLGTSYVDVNVDLAKGYAELRITFLDGKILTRVIYIV
jgi:hypothetical protein